MHPVSNGGLYSQNLHLGLSEVWLGDQNGEEVNKLSRYPIGCLNGEWNCLSPFRKVILDHKQVRVVLAGQRKLQNINSGHLPWLANGNI